MSSPVKPEASLTPPSTALDDCSPPEWYESLAGAIDFGDVPRRATLKKVSIGKSALDSCPVGIIRVAEFYGLLVERSRNELELEKRP